ncbi:MAG: hypothetical protein Q8P72_03965 [Candidatus Roizmanbacteria bacterium]|nr:hypothetical protein [Candidatus Roizmanbacteria bacterium]
MKILEDHKKLYAVIFLLLVVLGILILSLIAMQNKKQSVLYPSEMSKSETSNFRSILEIPTLGPEQNFAVDTDSSLIRDSASSIQALTSFLPYDDSFTTSNGTRIDIRISDRTYADNEWTLLVHIFGPDYQIPKNNSEYTANKVAFLDAAQNVFNFLETNNIDSSQLIIQWGDRAFVRERSEQWLGEK